MKTTTAVAIATIGLGVCSPAVAQWSDEGDWGFSGYLHPSNDQVEVVYEGDGYTIYGVTLPSGVYFEVEVDDPDGYRFDLNTSGATDTDSLRWGWPDGRVDIADMRLYFCLYNSNDMLADVSTTGAASGDSEWGVMDGVVDSSDIDFVVDWFAELLGTVEAGQMLVDTIGTGNPCENRGPGELGIALGIPQPEPMPDSAANGESEGSSRQIELIYEWRIELARDALFPHLTLDLVVKHYADESAILPATPNPIPHFAYATQESGFIMQFGVVPVSTKEIYNKQTYSYKPDICPDPVGESTLLTGYAATFKAGVFLPFNRPWMGLGKTYHVVHFQKSTIASNCL